MFYPFYVSANRVKVNQVELTDDEPSRITLLLLTFSKANLTLQFVTFVTAKIKSTYILACVVLDSVCEINEYDVAARE